jgi:hypothetical protein
MILVVSSPFSSLFNTSWSERCSKMEDDVMTKIALLLPLGLFGCAMQLAVPLRNGFGRILCYGWWENCDG